MTDSLDYLEYIKTQPCIICESPYTSPHHIKRIGMGRNRTNDLLEHYTAIPLCSLHHRELHDNGDSLFFSRYGIDLWQQAHQLLVGYISNL